MIQIANYMDSILTWGLCWQVRTLVWRHRSWVNQRSIFTTFIWGFLTDLCTRNFPILLFVGYCFTLAWRNLWLFAYNPTLLYFSAFLISAFKSFDKSIFRRVKSQTEKGRKWLILIYEIEVVIRFPCEVYKVYNILLRWDKYIPLANNFLCRVCKCI